MGNDQAYVYGDNSSNTLKLIADPGGVRVKMCPMIGDIPGGEIDEVENAIEIDLDRRGINHLIRELRRLRNRVFEADE